MKTNLPDDHLEKFIKESFDSFDAQPHDAVWSRIDQSLDHPVISKKTNFQKWYWALAASVVGILMVALICTNINLRKRLNEVMVSEHVPALIAPLPTPDQSNNDQSTPLTNSLSKSEDTFAVPHDFSTQAIEPLPSSTTAASELQLQVKIQDAATTVLSNNATEPVVTSVDKINRAGVVAQNQKKKSVTHGLFNNKSTQKRKLKTENTIDKSNASSDYTYDTVDGLNAAHTNHVKSIKENTTQELHDASHDEKKLNQSGFHVVSLDLNMPSLVSMDPASGMLVMPGINSIVDDIQIAHGARLFLGGYFGLLSESGDIEPKHKFMPGPPSGQNTYTSKDSWQAGLNISTSIGKRWVLQSGLGLKHYDLANELNQKLLFGARRPKPGNKPFEHDWDLKLNGPGGSTQIEVRSEQTDTRMTLNENELINVKVRNKMQLDYVSVPMTMGYRLGRGAWSVQFNAGLNIDFLIRKKFEQPVISIDNDLLKVRGGRQDAKFEQSNGTVFSGLLGTSLNYSLSKAIQLQLSPNLYLPFNHRERNKNIKVDSNSFGIQLGILYDMNSL